MRNAEIIISNLQELIETNDAIRKDGTQNEYEDGVIYEGEYGQDMTDCIDCPHYGDDCLAENKGLKYATREWNEACSACKALWLMEEVE